MVPQQRKAGQASCVSPKESESSEMRPSTAPAVSFSNVVGRMPANAGFGSSARMLVRQVSLKRTMSKILTKARARLDGEAIITRVQAVEEQLEESRKREEDLRRQILAVRDSAYQQSSALSQGLGPAIIQLQQ